MLLESSLSELWNPGTYQNKCQTHLLGIESAIFRPEGFLDVPLRGDNPGTAVGGKSNRMNSNLRGEPVTSLEQTTPYTHVCYSAPSPHENMPE